MWASYEDNVITTRTPWNILDVVIGHNLGSRDHTWQSKQMTCLCEQLFSLQASNMSHGQSTCITRNMSYTCKSIKLVDLHRYVTNVGRLLKSRMLLTLFFNSKKIRKLEWCNHAWIILCVHPNKDQSFKFWQFYPCYMITKDVDNNFIHEIIYKYSGFVLNFTTWPFYPRKQGWLVGFSLCLVKRGKLVGVFYLIRMGWNPWPWVLS